MTDQDFDRLIDTAAGQVVSHGPSRQLKGAVMARVSEAEPATPRRFVWASAAVAVVLCGVIAIALMTREVGPVNQKAVAHAPVVQAPARTAPVRAVANPTPEAPSSDKARSYAAVRLPSERPKAAVRSLDRQASSIQPPPAVISTIEPLVMEPIVMTVVEVPPLDYETAPIDQIEIAPLTIEPLSAAND